MRSSPVAGERHAVWLQRGSPWSYGNTNSCHSWSSPSLFTASNQQSSGKHITTVTDGVLHGLTRMCSHNRNTAYTFQHTHTTWHKCFLGTLLHRLQQMFQRKVFQFLSSKLILGEMISLYKTTAVPMRLYGCGNWTLMCVWKKMRWNFWCL